jgi:hypothetical protein
MAYFAENGMKKTLSAPFSARNLGAGVWQLGTGALSGPEIYLRDTGPDAHEVLQDVSITAVGCEWRIEGVKVALTLPNGVRYLTVGGAIIHEPQARLYESLPLAGFDSGARRFWKRVFRLMRLPGGRFLLGFIARRNHRRPGTASQ